MNLLMTLTPFATLWADALLRGALDATVVLGLTWLITLPLRRQWPVLTVWLWRAALLKILLSMAGVGIGLVPMTSAPVRGGAGPAVADPLSLLIAGLSLLGAVAYVGSGLRQAAAIARIRRSSILLTEFADPGLLTALERAARRVGLGRLPDVLVNEAGYGPMLTGVVRPVIILPEQACGSPRTVTLMGLHELAHVARYDLLWGWLLALAEAVLFFHPLVYVARREILLGQEMACDQAVVAMDRSLVGTYARLLLEASEETRAPVMALGMRAVGRGLERRLLALQNLSSARGRVGPLPALLPTLLACCIAPYTLLGSLSPAPPPAAAAMMAPAAPSAALPVPDYPSPSAVAEPVRTPAGPTAPSGAGAGQPIYRARVPFAKVRASLYEPIAQGH